MTVYIHQVSEPTVERVERNGREYLKFPIVPLREMVYDYPEEGTREYLPAAHIAESAEAWAGTPITAVHPPDRGDGQTVNHPEAFVSENIGEVHNPQPLEGGEKLRLDAFIDIEKAEDIGGLAAEVVELLEDGEELATSPGYGTMGDEYINGMHAGEEYDLVQGVPLPDHVAVFPNDEFKARCSPEEGCAAPRVNAIEDQPGTEFMQGSQVDDIEVRESDRRRLGSLLLNALGWSDGEDRQNAEEKDECSEGPCSCGEHVNTNNEDTNEADETDDETTEETEPMDDERLNQLVEETPFSEDQLTEMTDEQLEAISPTNTSDDGGEEVVADGGEVEDEETTEDSVDEEEVAELKANYKELEQRLNAMEEEKRELEREKNARIVCNALDMEMDTALDMSDEALAELAEKHEDSVETDGPRTNYSAVPGSVDREPSTPDSEVDDYPAGGRSAYENRANGGN